jgi:hypothetical protein
LMLRSDQENTLQCLHWSSFSEPQKRNAMTVNCSLQTTSSLWMACVVILPLYHFSESASKLTCMMHETIRSSQKPPDHRWFHRGFMVAPTIHLGDNLVNDKITNFRPLAIGSNLNHKGNILCPGFDSAYPQFLCTQINCNLSTLYSFPFWG